MEEKYINITLNSGPITSFKYAPTVQQHRVMWKGVSANINLNLRFNRRSFSHLKI